MEIKIVKMTKEDLPELFWLAKKHWPDESWVSQHYLQTIFKEENLAYTAKTGDRIVGGV